VAQVGISGSTKIGNQVTLAGQVGVVGHLTIGDNAVIAAQSGIMNNVEPGAVLFGSPARPHRETMKIQAILSKLPELYDTVKALKKKFLS
jgi:UDP-3-O-[3-hydroxymyristoyl] glucosamine N-acyltransferase